MSDVDKARALAAVGGAAVRARRPNTAKYPAQVRFEPYMLSRLRSPMLVVPLTENAALRCGSAGSFFVHPQC